MTCVCKEINFIGKEIEKKSTAMAQIHKEMSCDKTEIDFASMNMNCAYTEIDFGRGETPIVF